MENSSKSLKDKKFDNDKLRAAIMLSVDVESNFRLFSYRCIPNDAFTERITDLIDRFITEVKKATAEYNQSELEFESNAVNSENRTM